MAARIVILAAAIAIVSGAILLVIASFQTQLLFPVHAVGPPGPVPREAKAISVKTPDGATLHGLHIPPQSSAEGQRRLILGFGGNAWNGSDVATYLHRLYPEADVVAFHYRGYRPSSGSPSADALLADAPLVHDAAVELVKPSETFAVGFSIGSGVAADLARHRPLDGLILVTPFDSLKAAAGDLYPWLPVGLFFAHEIDAAAALSAARLPVALLAAEHDTLIVPKRTEALRKRIPNVVFHRTIAGAGHNDIYHRPEMQQGMREALNAITKALK